MDVAPDAAFAGVLAGFEPAVSPSDFLPPQPAASIALKKYATMRDERRIVRILPIGWCGSPDGSGSSRCAALPPCSPPLPPFETIRQFRTAVAFVCESRDQEGEGLGVPGNPER